ncbi:lipid II flippase MurJ [Phytohabitans rumicis]|uniref:Membrane protein n=1 Tax=Phytohabitans rumicis TaxID=1076125 RepID=A0A6V8KUW9_9ACTN|nr:lipid II flippase MurJ [Phytohabitans rumicis]GFJ87240.1 membrane protein [Phytohabitans rumicis]
MTAPTTRGTAPPAEGARPALATAAILTVAITISGSLLGLLRDVLLARWFGAGPDTDAFLVSWTVPETAFCLVVEGAMSLLMVPLFSQAIARQRSVRDLVTATMPRVVVTLAVASAAVALGAPLLVRLIAPGLDDPALAITCTRITAFTVLAFGIAGYLSAGLRAHHVFAAPAAIHVAYNAGIVALMWTMRGRLGVVSAAAGVAAGGLLMVLVQVPGFRRHVGFPALRRHGRATGTSGTLALGVLAPVVAYTVARQAQVWVERFLGSALPAGTISHLNYAQKLAQLPMLVALLVCTVTFPTLARAIAAGDLAHARRRLESDVRAATLIVMLGAAYLFVFAPAVIQTLLQHGAFGPADTAATAALVRVYAAGLLGHALVGVLVRPFFAGGGRTWYPALAMAIGLTVNLVGATLAVSTFGVTAITAANGAGVTTTAVLLLVGLRRRAAAIGMAAVAAVLARAAAAALAAAAAGCLAGRLMSDLDSTVVSVVGGVVVLATFTTVARLLGVEEMRFRRGR